MQRKLTQKLIVGICVWEILFLDFDNPTLAASSLSVDSTPKLNHNKTIPLIVSSPPPLPNQKAKFDQSLEMVNEMDNSPLKITLLNDLALNYAQLGDSEKAIAILDQSLSIAKSFEDVVAKVTSMTNIAKYYAQIGQKSRAIEILNNTVNLVSVVADKSLQGQLLLDISFKYREIGEDDTAQNILQKSQTIIAETSEPLPEFPFTETPSNFKLGFAGFVNSFRDTTAFVGIDVDFYKQWPKNDIWVDSTIYLSFDSSRSVNNYRPGSLIYTVYRHHFDSQWSFFTIFFNSTNEDLFSSKNDDEDLVIISALYFGGGFNLWRGDSPNNFIDFQLGIGPRYEYDFIDFEQRRNQASPTLGVILFGRGFSIGQAKLANISGIFPALDNFNNYILSSDTKLSIPLSKRWSFTNRMFVRYRNQTVIETNPKWLFLFSTGLEYEF